MTYKQKLKRWKRRRMLAKELRAKNKSLSEIGRILGVSRQRVKQMVDLVSHEKKT